MGYPWRDIKTQWLGDFPEPNEAVIYRPDEITIHESSLTLTRVQISAKISPNDLPLFNQMSKFHNVCRNYNDSLSVLHVKNYSMTKNFYDFMTVMNIEFSCLPTEETKGYDVPMQDKMFEAKIIFDCTHFVREAESAGVRFHKWNSALMSAENLIVDPNDLKLNNYSQEDVP
jgi:hypothetical protein